VISRELAAMAVRRPAWLIAVVVVLVVASLFRLQSREAFDSDILNLLPCGTPSVEGLRIYNTHFNSTRELAFLVEAPADSDAADRFAAELAVAPWIERILDAPPLESQAGRDSLPTLAAPLLLSQEESAFDATLALLSPEALTERLSRLVRETAAGSPLARIELETDPTGLITPIARGLAEKLSVADAFDLVSTDGMARIIPAITTQASPSAQDCSKLMAEVHAFIASFQSALPSDVHISVTGRSAYVDEISRSMQRDIFITSLVSICAVAALFWLAFRSFLPLVGSILILGITCLVTLACGSLFFDKLNVVAMAFCSILVGLGDDFSLLLYQRYAHARGLGRSREDAISESTRHAAPGILWVALTTSLGFAALLGSSSAGFAQLGALIAIGVFLGALGMIFLMPLFERQVPCLSAKRDPVAWICEKVVKNAPRVLLAASGIVLVALLLAVLPWRSLHFDTTPQSLEPRDIPASRTLARMMEKFPATFEPVMVILRPPTAVTTLLDLDDVLAGLRDTGVIASFSSPSPLVGNSKQMEKNLQSVRALDWSEVERAISSVETRSGLSAGALDPATRLVRELQSEAPVAERLPSSSPWWFVLDRAMAPATGEVIYYIRIPYGADRAVRERVENAIHRVAPEALVTGWSQMLNALVPWASQELVVFGTLVLGVILLLLIATYRKARDVLWHLATLALAMAGTVATLKCLGQPINLLNVLAFPLILAVGVDYGVHLILAAREPGNRKENIALVMKPVLMSGLTTVTGFGALVLATNPALKGLGIVCATGVAWSLFVSLCFLGPILLRGRVRST